MYMRFLNGVFIPAAIITFIIDSPKLLMHAQAKGPPLVVLSFLLLKNKCLTVLNTSYLLTTPAWTLWHLSILMTSTDAPHRVWSLPVSTLLCLWVGTSWPLANKSNVSNLPTFLSSMEECRRPVVLSAVKEWHHKKTGATTLSALLLIMTSNLS